MLTYIYIYIYTYTHAYRKIKEVFLIQNETVTKISLMAMSM